MIYRFGVQLAPGADGLGDVLGLARLADEDGLDLLGVQDHPYASGLADTFAVIGAVLAGTERIRVFPDVACLPLRGPGVLAKQAATLDLLSGGRFELGLGAGGFWTAIAAMGGPHLTASQALVALEEAIAIIRAMWRPGETVKVRGKYHTVDGVHAGPAPAHPVGVWLGSQGPKALALTGRVADGWAAPIARYLPYERLRWAQDVITRAAGDAGRDPAAVTRIAQLVGEITDAPRPVRLEGAEPVRTDVAGWADVLARLAGETGFDTFVYWPVTTGETQLRRWSREVVPAARALIAKR
ncbi:LLM class flavin-dependent oxidoreductase [Actinomadura graeca]|uniref:LLM class flavin-dependent oxidoreductase n=1 Tax=Actinomadura graeca TaxID=2750812 RepID=A0ABX8R572_9ACTN|nr:LLM class flavin-dependent oxidoreductase [Actinomadura graeca]QXJ25419.1 LLM class flavin-dependent oxidoreductase [Actinomadura graeca]